MSQQTPDTNDPVGASGAPDGGAAAGGYQPAPGAYPQQPGYQGGTAQPLTDSDARMWAMLGHVGAILIGFIAPLITWLVFRERSPLVDDQGKESLNFQITVIIAYAVATVLALLLIGIILFPIIWIASLVLCIMAGVAANRGERYRYPLTLRLIK